jgi:hypothetical protein
MKRKLIAYDIDGCIVDSAPWFTLPLLVNTGNVGGDIYCRDDKGHEIFDYNTPGICHSAMSDIIAKSISIYHQYMRPVMGAVQAIRDIHAVTGEIPHYLTCRRSDTNSAFFLWQEAQGLPPKYVYKQLGRHSDKAKWLKEWGVTHYVEDRHKNAVEIAAAGIRVYLMDRPYNDRPFKSKRIIRVTDWAEIVADFLDINIIEARKNFRKGK